MSVPDGTSQGKVTSPEPAADLNAQLAELPKPRLSGVAERAPRGLHGEETGWPLGADAVTTALALGWQLSALYGAGALATEAADGPRASETDRPAPADREPHDRTLPDLVDLTAGEREHVALSQVHGRILRLDRLISDPACAAWPLEKAAVMQDRAARRRIRDLDEKVAGLHRDLLRTMACVDVRVGKGYRLGTSLEQLCRPLGSEPLRERLAEDRVAPVRELLCDLVTALPDHSGEPVLRSLDAWVAHAGDGEAPPVGDGDLHVQGKRWRALLTGETRPTDLVSSEKLVETAGASLRTMKRLARSAAFLFWPALTVVTVLAVALVAGALLVVDSDGNKLASAMVTVGAWVAAVWRVIGPRVKQVMEDMKGPLVGAAWNEAVADAITRPEGVRDRLGP